ncbi:type 1 glutamine amidotransferase [Parasedimentitalea huanghaiensis]|nr:type 1 glutamine amidotransferase [Zongyanglinia huanghaiensis]
MTNTDSGDFADSHPKDGEKFTNLVHMVRPGWEVSVFPVKDGEFPDDIAGFDGAMITGSPASVRGDHDWIPPLLQLIRDMNDKRHPLFGACFGHQAIALALGGSMAQNPKGWVHGLTHNTIVARPEWGQDLPDQVGLYGSHIECVTDLPKGAVQIAESDTMITGFAMGNHIYTTQHHPEMSHGFISALTEELRSTLGPEVFERAIESLQAQSDQQVFAESIARFFEQGRRWSTVRASTHPTPGSQRHQSV